MSLCSISITETSSLLHTSPPLCTAFLLSILPFCDLYLFDSHQYTGSCVPHGSLSYAHAAFMPDAKQTASGLASALIPIEWWTLGFDISLRYRHLCSGSLSFIFIRLTCPFLLYGLFLRRSLPRLLTLAAEGCLADLPDQSLPEGPPPSSMQLSQHTTTVHTVRYTAVSIVDVHGLIRPG